MDDRIDAYRQLADALEDIQVFRNFIALLPYAVRTKPEIKIVPRFIAIPAIPEQRKGSPPQYFYRPLPK